MSHLHLTSPAFTHNTGIPLRFTCDGDNLSPSQGWSGVPAGAKGLALIIDDPDAPDPAAPKMTWVHWVLYNIPVKVGRLQEGVSRLDLPSGTLEGQNDWKRPGYGGPCPPVGRHRYFFKLFVLDVLLPDLHTPTKGQLEAAMAGHVIDKTELIGTYQRLT